MVVEIGYGIRYGTAGKLLDIHRPAAPPPGAPVVLLWHGRGPDERDVLRPLAGAAAKAGAVVVVPDWDSSAPDGGRTQLLESLEYVRRHAARMVGDAGRVVLAGWSLGGRAALSLALCPAVVGGWRPRSCVGIAAGSPAESPIVRIDPAAAPVDPVEPVPIRLVHGTADTVVDVSGSRDLCAALRRRGWPVSLAEPDSDHAGVVLSEYVPELKRCRPSRCAHARRAGRVTVQSLVGAP